LNVNGKHLFGYQKQDKRNARIGACHKNNANISPPPIMIVVPMADLECRLERFETLAAECELIAKLATDGRKRELYLRLALPYGQKIETAQRRQRSNIFGLGPVLHNKLAVDA
jgi:hypothetical protein